MGYTHYWSHNRDFTAAEWNELRLQAMKVVRVAQDNFGISLAEEYDRPTRAPVINDEEIRFNGVGEEGHETFHITRKRKPNPSWRKIDDDNFDFCKTARKPYDAAVVACLIEAAQINDRFTWSSDGDGEGGVLAGADAILNHKEFEGIAA